MDEIVVNRRDRQWQDASVLHTVPETIPDYLEKHYRWAYLDPVNARILDRRMVTEFILWGHYGKLCNQVIDQLPRPGVDSQVLQVACAYGDLTPRLARQLSPSGRLDVVDVSPLQIELVRSKTNDFDNVRFAVQNSARLDAADASYDMVVLFFLLHEMPADVRRRTLEEALRVCRPGGKVVITDYHGPRRAHPLRYLMRPLLARLEPFALDMWDKPLAGMLPEGVEISAHRRYFGGLYQFAVIHP